MKIIDRIFFSSSSSNKIFLRISPVSLFLSITIIIIKYIYRNILILILPIFEVINLHLKIFLQYAHSINHFNHFFKVSSKIPFYPHKVQIRFRVKYFTKIRICSPKGETVLYISILFLSPLSLPRLTMYIYIYIYVCMYTLPS